MKSLINFLLKWIFLLNETNREQVKGYRLLVWISQWLNQNPDFNLEDFVDFIINWEEELLIKEDIFDDNQKQLIILYAFINLNIIRDLAIEPTIKQFGDQESILDIFGKDDKYYQFTKIVLKYLRNDFYDEKELYTYLKYLKRNDFKKYSWKNIMLGEI